MSGFWLVSYVLLWVVVVVLAVGLFSLYHHFGTMYLKSREGRAAQGPAVGKFLGVTEDRGLAGEPVRWPVAGRPTVLLFFGTDCSICASLKALVLPRLVASSPDVRFVVLCGGGRDAVAKWAEGVPEGVPVVPDPRFRIAQRHQIALTPFAVAVGGDGVVTWRGVASSEEILEHAVAAARVEQPGGGLAVTQVPSHTEEVSA